MKTAPSIHYLLWSETAFPFAPNDAIKNQLIAACSKYVYWVTSQVGFAVSCKIEDFNMVKKQALIRTVKGTQTVWVNIDQLHCSESDADIR